MSANIGTGLTKTFCLCSLNDLNIIFQRDLSLPSRPCLVLSCSILNSCLSYLPYYHSPHQRHIYLHLPLLKCLIVLITALINPEHRSQSQQRKNSPPYPNDKADGETPQPTLWSFYIQHSITRQILIDKLLTCPGGCDVRHTTFILHQSRQRQP